MKRVGHNAFNTDDILTIYIIISLFENVLMKQEQMILCLPKIVCILDFLNQIGDHPQCKFDQARIVEFNQTIQQQLKKVIRLEGILNFMIAYSLTETS
jgi:flagellar biosynthesis protein FliQ